MKAPIARTFGLICSMSMATTAIQSITATFCTQSGDFSRKASCSATKVFLEWNQTRSLRSGKSRPPLTSTSGRIPHQPSILSCPPDSAKTISLAMLSLRRLSAEMRKKAHWCKRPCTVESLLIPPTLSASHCAEGASRRSISAEDLPCKPANPSTTLRSTLPSVKRSFFKSRQQPLRQLSLKQKSTLLN